MPKSKFDMVGTPMQVDDRRRSQRVMIRIPVKIEWTASGKALEGDAVTVSVNVHGAMLLCDRSLDTGAKLEVINARTQERAAARVTRSSQESGDKYLVPVEFVTPSPSFWQISFPESNWKPPTT